MKSSDGDKSSKTEPQPSSKFWGLSNVEDGEKYGNKRRRLGWLMKA